MKTLVIWFIDKVSVLAFVLFLIGAFLVGYMGGDLVTSFGSRLGIEELGSIHEDSETIKVLLGVFALIIAFIIGSLIFGILFLLLNMESNIRQIRKRLEELSD